MKTRKFEEELGSLKQQISMLEQHIAQLRTELAQRPVRQTSPEPEIKPVHQATPEVQPASREPAPAKKPSHPRQGDLTSEDVSIEKYFNFSGR